MKSFLFNSVLFFILLVSHDIKAQDRLYRNEFPLKDVTLLEGPFKHARDLNIQTLLNYDVDRLLAPYRKEAGLPAKAAFYPNWEGLDGHIGGHYLSAMAMNYTATNNAECKRRMEYIITELKACTEASEINNSDWGKGYIGGVPKSKVIWGTLQKGDFTAYSSTWAPWYNLHKLYAGLRDTWIYTGNKDAKTIFLKFCDWGINITSSLTDEQMQTMLDSEQGGMNEIFADAYLISGDEKYLTAAKRFSHRMLLDAMSAYTDNLDNKHANTQIPKAIGFQRIAELTHDINFTQAGSFFWETVTGKRSLAFGGNSRREFFPSASSCIEFITDVEGPESCNSYNMLKLTEGLFRTNPLAKYTDYYERTLYNHILSTQHPEHGGYVYFTPARPRHYRVYSAPSEAMWCCVGTGMENHGKYNQFIYTHKNDTLYLNLFIASELNWQEKGIKIKQETVFPDEEKTKLTVTKGSSHFCLMIRYPSWVKDAALKIIVNGKVVSYKSLPSSYIAIDRLWKAGDVVQVLLPMHNSIEHLPNVASYIAIMHGPILLGAKTGTEDLKGLIADDGRWGQLASGQKLPVDKAPIIIEDHISKIADELVPVKDKPLTFATPGLKMVHPIKVVLEPFYKIHDARYMMYWMSLTNTQYRSYIDSLAVQEKENLELQKQFPFQNPELSSEERAQDLITRLTLSEKSSLMCDISDAIPRLGIKKFNWWSEALHGLANNGNVTVFPEPVGMAASFDDQLLYRIFNATSDEVRARYNESKQKGQENKRFLSLSVWTPNINIFRDPRWGRGQETYGEDPYLMSRMGLSVVKGLQGPSDSKYKKLLACAKHYAVHSGPEWSRHEINLNNVDPRDLWETYLPAFKALVQEADVRQVMCAYQRLDDEPCCGNSRLLQKILRDEWGFKYIVVSDCGAIADFYTSHKVSSDAIHAVSKGVLAGTDVECQWINHNYKKLPDAVAKGLITEEEINKHLMRILVGRFDLGEMDDDALVPWTKIPVSVVNNDEHKKLALEMALESMTLLQNKNNILPLKKSHRKIAVIGPNANDIPMLWGNYNGTPVRTITILDGITSKIPAGRLVYDKGCDLVEDKVTESYFSKCSIEGKKGFKATYWNNKDLKGDIVATQQIENPIKLTVAGQHEFAPGVRLEGFSAKYETEFESSQNEDIVFKYGATGHFELLINGESVTRYDNWRTLPSRHSFKVEKGENYKIEIRYTQLNDWQANLEFNFGREVDVKFTDLLKKLQETDVVVFVGGLSTQLEGEEMPVSYPGFKGGDRTDIELPLVQRNCLKALKQAGKKVIFVNCSGSAIALLPETESCDAILQAWYGGESGGQAVADVLFGDFNPSGKLPITFYRNSQQLPDFENYSMKSRTYRYMSDPLFPFGFGLSYTTFSIGTAEISRNKISKDGDIELIIPVSNTGKWTGTEIIQVYVHKVNDTDGPIKTLKGFKRIELASGKSGEAVIDLPSASFEFFDLTSGKMAVTPGEYELWYGNSSAVRDLKMAMITIQ